MKDFLPYFISILLLCSCSSKEEKDKIDAEKIVLNYMRDNFHHYSLIYKEIGNELAFLENSNIRQAVGLKTSKYKLDSLFFFNEKRNRFISSVLYQTSKKGRHIDQIDVLHGIKINNKWKVTIGPFYNFYRHSYLANVKDPLSFETLTFLSHKKVFSRFYSIINDTLVFEEENYKHIFEDERSVGVYSKKLNQSEWDSIFINRAEEYYSFTVNQNEMDAIIKSSKEAVSDPDPEPEMTRARLKSIESHQRIMKALYPDKYALPTKL